MERQGVEVATSQSQVRRRNHYTAEPPNRYEDRMHGGQVRVIGWLGSVVVRASDL